jgi:hypothetical protein
MAYICSKDPSHQSEDSDYCSICGAKIAGAPSALPGSAPPSLQSVTTTATSPTSTGGASGSVCPDCGTNRTPGARFCEVCRYDFDRNAPSPTAPPPPLAAQPVASPVPVDVPAAPPVAAPVTGQPSAAVPTTPAPPADVPLPVALPNQPAAAGVGGLLRWEALVVVDSTLYTDPDPDIPLPVNEPERTFPLDFAENLLGRRSDRKDIHPEIMVGDPGVSHRHAKLLRQPDGSFMLLDVGSTNGTRLNGIDVLPGVRTPLRDGDEITLGCWTRITIRSIFLP